MNSLIYQQNFQQRKDYYNLLLQYIDRQYDNIEDFELFISSLQNYKEREDIYEIPQLLSKIINHHHRNKYFFQRIEQIFIFLKNVIKEEFSDFEIFKIIQVNQRIILFLLKNNIISFNDSIVDYLNQNPLPFTDKLDNIYIISTQSA